MLHVLYPARNKLQVTEGIYYEDPILENWKHSSTPKKMEPIVEEYYCRHPDQDQNI